MIYYIFSKEWNLLIGDLLVPLKIIGYMKPAPVKCTQKIYHNSYIFIIFSFSY